MIFRAALRLLACLTLPAAALASAATRPLFPTPNQIAALRADADWKGLRKSCQSDLKLTIAPPDDISPLSHYTESGVRAPQPNDPAKLLARDSFAVYRLGLCFEISGDKSYSTKAEQILTAWAATTTKASTEQGKTDINFSFPFALIGASFLSRDDNWHPESFNTFVRQLILPASHAGRDNNHAEWGVLLWATAAAYLEDDALMKQALDRWQALLIAQVAADGSLPLEICRSNTTNWCGGATKGIRGLAYTHYTLYPATLAAEIFRAMGHDLYSTEAGHNLCRAYDRGTYWTAAPEQFPYYLSNGGKLEDTHNINYYYVLVKRCASNSGPVLLNQYGSSAPDAALLHVLYPR